MPRKTSTRRVAKAPVSKTRAASAKKKAQKPKATPAKTVKAKKTQGKPRVGAASKVAKSSITPKDGTSSRQTKRVITPKGKVGKSGARKKTAVSNDSKTTFVKPGDVFATTEADIVAAIDSLNNRMNQAVTSLMELAAAQQGPMKEAVVRMASLDRATATFQRLIGEVVDDQLAEMLLPMIALRNEMASYEASPDALDRAFPGRSRETIDQILAGANVQPFHPRIGETFDPLIHLAVGETSREDLPDGAVAEVFQPGFRSVRGKVFQTARVKVNRR